MMPQKKNPDVAELARGTTGIGVGALTGLLVTLKSLPLAYDRDLQTDKQHVREVFASTAAAFTATAGLVREMTFVTERLAEAASDPALLATDAAEDLVRDGVPFRRAHEQVASRARSGALDDGRLSAPGAVARRSVPGGPSPRSIRAQARRLGKLARPK